MIIPVDAIDPTATARRWSEKFTYHLDLIPIVLEAIVETTLPALGVSRGGSRFDRPQVTGGGYQDTMSAMLAVFDQSGRADGIQPSAAVKDARELWSWLVEYTQAVDAWIAPTRPAAPRLPPRRRPAHRTGPRPHRLRLAHRPRRHHPHRHRARRAQRSDVHRDPPPPRPVRGGSEAQDTA